MDLNFARIFWNTGFSWVQVSTGTQAFTGTHTFLETQASPVLFILSGIGLETFRMFKEWIRTV